MAVFTLFICLALATVEGQVVVSEYFQEQLNRLLRVEPEVDNSCGVRRSQATHDLFIVCPSEVNCYVKAYSKDIKQWIVPRSPFQLDSECQAISDLLPLPVNKSGQLKAVLQVLRLSEESACEFSSIETLNLYGTSLANMDGLGGGNCLMDKCPRKLKYLNLSFNRMEKLSNDLFCQFRQLEYLEIEGCHISQIEDGAFALLGQLREIKLENNQLTHLPVDLFRNNTRLENVNLVRNRLTSRDLFPLMAIKSLRHLFLNYNQIQLFDDHLIFPSELNRFYMTFNQIKEISLQLANLTRLTQLALFNNQISRVDKNAFQNMSALTFVNIEKNRLEQLHKDTFKNNVNLEKLYLNENSLSKFPAVGHLRKLSDFQAVGNRISSINKDDFINCTQLSNVDLSNNQLSFIERGSFGHVEQLETLSLAGNRLSEVNADFTGSNILKMDLRFNNFSIFTFDIFPLNVKILGMLGNRMETIEPYNFLLPGGKEWNLTHLDLSTNRIRSIESLKLPPSIRYLNLSNNQISRIMSLDDLKAQNLRSLSSIDFQNNNISTLCLSSFRKFGGSVNKVKYFISGNPLICSCENWWLKSPQVYAEYMSIMDIEGVSCQQPFPFPGISAKQQLLWAKDTTFLCVSDHINTNRCECSSDVDRMRCRLPCPTNCTCLSDFFLLTVRFMCEKQQLARVPVLQSVSIYNHTRLFVNLSYNAIPRLGPEDFDDFPKTIIFLDLSHSSVRTIEKNSFDGLINLTGLALSYNQLESLPHGLFLKTTLLTHLDLSNNRLRYLADGLIGHLLNLKVLLLHNNSLSRFQVSQLASMDFLEHTSLGYNPWSCDCSFITSFRKVVLNSTRRVDVTVPLFCHENGQELNMFNMNLDHCVKQLNLTILITCLVFAALSMTTVILAFKWRLELQVLIYSRYGFRMSRGSEVVDDKQYDAFIAYSSEDGHFLVHELMPGLESIEKPYRLCIHERDFPAGSYIQDSILDAISMSSRTIVILSENFVQSGWCRYEFKSAHAQMLQDRCPRILVIVLGEVPKVLEPEMQLYLRTNTYLKWGERLFWQKLYYAMPDLRVTSPPTHIMPMRMRIM